MCDGVRVTVGPVISGGGTVGLRPRYRGPKYKG